MTRSSFGLCLSAFALTVFSAGSLAPVLAQTPDAAVPDSIVPASGDAAQKSSHSHNDSAGLALLGLVAGGAALMGGGSHGQSGSPGSSFVASALAPQMIYTPPASAAASVSAPATSAAPAVISTPVPAIITKTLASPVPGTDAPPVIDTASAPVSTFAPVSPVVIVTYPTGDTAPPIVKPLPFLPSSTGTAPLSPAPTAGLPLPDAVPEPGTTSLRLAPTAGLPLPDAVPEPGTTAALVLGSLLLGNLLMRARRTAAG